MDHNQIIDQLKQKKYAPVYFLSAEEPYFIDIVVDYIENNVLDESEKAFNQVVLYGKETDSAQVLDQVMQFPMMASHRVVIIKEAQELKGLENMIPYFNNPSQQSILVLAYKHKTIDKRKTIWSAIKTNAVVLESKRIYDNQLPAYVKSMVEAKGIKISQKECLLISEYLGNNLSKISNEVEKLALNVETGAQVTPEHIQEFIGINKDFNIFELQNAIGKRNKVKAYSIIKYFSQNEKANPIQRNIATLFGYFTKIFVAKKYQKVDDRTLASKLKVSPFFVSDYKLAAKNYELSQIKYAFNLLHELDKKSKGIDTRRNKPLGLYQEFLYKLFNHSSA